MEEIDGVKSSYIDNDGLYEVLRCYRAPIKKNDPLYNGKIVANLEEHVFKLIRHKKTGKLERNVLIDSKNLHILIKR